MEWKISIDKSDCPFNFFSASATEEGDACLHVNSKTNICGKDDCPVKSGRVGKYNYGKEQQEIAEKLGFENVKEAMKQLYDSGLSCAKIAKKFNLNSQMTVYQRLKAMGVQTRGRGQKTIIGGI